MKPKSILKQHFGYEGFRPGQEKVVSAILGGRDSLAIMPTGAGKSLCFQVPAIMMDGTTLVISPLISLMQDQVAQLVQNGIPAAYVNSSLTIAQMNKVMDNASSGKYKIIYVAPERLETFEFVQFAKQADVSMVAVDEAHCVSHWGQDFRPSYLNISAFVENLSSRPILSAFTATATSIVKKDIVKLLGLHDPFELTTGFNRKNLFFEVRTPKSKQTELESYLQENNEKSGIVYCSTRKTVEEVTAKLNKRGFNAVKYHAGMAQNARTKSQQDFLHDRVPVIIATNAFGMGIDKSNVSYVVHFNMPKSVESYYQEAGRAGRDGSPAECVLFFSYQDIVVNKFLIEQTDPENNLSDAELKEVKARDYKRLREMEDYCNSLYCLRHYILDYFGDTGDRDCDNCSNCQNGGEKEDATIQAQKILSCIIRMKGRFGISHLISVLQGTNTDKVKSWGHHGLSTFGIMADESQDKIRHVLRFLMQQGYVNTVGDRYPVLETTAKARDVLSGEAHIAVPVLPEKQAARKKQVLPSINEKLFDELKKLRLKIANDENVPAFVIFTDAALRDMSMRLPKNEREFLQVMGVGEVKLNKYGKLFLEAINGYSAPDEKPDAVNINENIWADFLAAFKITDQEVYLTDFMQRVNKHAESMLGRKISREKISTMLEDAGYLENILVHDKNTKLATEKGVKAGLRIIEVTSQSGKRYKRNLYNQDAQRLILDLAVKSFFERGVLS